MGSICVGSKLGCKPKAPLNLTFLSNGCVFGKLIAPLAVERAAADRVGRLTDAVVRRLKDSSTSIYF